MPAFHTIDTLDPWHNLAVERHLFETVANHALLVWRNSPCVVIGRHQNPWMECDLVRMAAELVPLVRRVSGGGAVYHDPGNVNFTFFGTDATYDLHRQFAVVLAALESLAIPARRNDRNDILVGHRKISGNAFRHTKGRSLHHGTLLVSADLEKLAAYLASPMAAGPTMISSKGIASVRSGVANLQEFREDLRHEAVVDALRAAYLAEYGGQQEAPVVPGAPVAGVKYPVPDDLDAEQLAANESELSSWEWRFGKTPTFSLRVTAGVPVGPPARSAAGEFMVTVRHGRVETVTTGSSGPAAVARTVEGVLRGARFVREDIVECRDTAQVDAAGESVGVLLTAIGDAAGPASA